MQNDRKWIGLVVTLITIVSGMATCTFYALDFKELFKDIIIGTQEGEPQGVLSPPNNKSDYNLLLDEEKITVNKGNYWNFDIELEEEDYLELIYVTNTIMKVMIMDSNNFEEFAKGRRYQAYYLPSRTTAGWKRWVAPYKGRWHLIFLNEWHSSGTINLQLRK